MLSYCAKGINKFTAANRVGAFRRPANCECQLSCSAFNKFAHSNRPAAVQHPFWGDVSFFSRCEAAFSNLTWTPICLEPQQPDSSTFESLNPAIHEPPKLI